VHESWDGLTGLKFWAQTKNRPAQNGYGPSMDIDFIITAEDPAYPRTAKELVPVPRKSAREELDDEIPY
jgi:hypothetical protein